MTTYARHGVYCYYVQPSAAFDGMHLALSTLTNAIHYVSLYWYDNLSSGAIQVSLNGNAFYDLTTIGGMDGGWIRGGVQIPAAQASGATRLYIRISADEDFYIDSVDVTPTEYPTTHNDGDQPGCRWTGLRHGSTSTRSAQERSGGRERNLLDDYGIEVVEGTKRVGMPPIVHHLHDRALQPGAGYQGHKVLPREIEWHLNYKVETDAGSIAANWAAFHGKRQDVIDLIKPDLVRGAQPVTIGYAGAGTDKKLYAQFYYNGGLEFGDFLAYDEVAPVRLLAPDPFWYEDNQETAALDYQDSVTSAAYGMRRIDGDWLALGSGFNGNVRCIAIDKQRGRVYFGGAFTTANGVTVNRICYWDGTTFVVMRGAGGVGVAGGDVRSIAIAANGDVWIAGSFTTVDGSGSRNYVARWNVSTSTWTNFGTTGTGAAYAVAIDQNGLVYVGFDGTNWGADADQDYITSYNGTSWVDVGTTTFTAKVNSIAIDSTNRVIAGSDDGTVRRWDGTSWTTLVTVTGSTADVLAVGLDANDDIYFTGAFTAANSVSMSQVGKYAGSGVVDIGDRNDDVATVINTTIARFSDGRVAFTGQYTGPDGAVANNGIAYWNGSTFADVDADIQTVGQASAVAEFQGDVYAGFIGTGTATVSGQTTATNGSTTVTFPRLTVLNANSSGSCVLEWLENQSTTHRMYFSLTIQAGETVTLDLRNSQKKLISDWRGVITDNPLKNSDVVNWHLLPGANVIAAFVTGTTTSVTALLHWTPRHWAIDGAA